MSKDKNSTETGPVNEVPTSESRRTIVKTTLAGTAAVTGAATANIWSKPVVDSVILPAHATTSEVDADGGEGPRVEPRNFFGTVSGMAMSAFNRSRNDVRIAGQEDSDNLLEKLASGVVDAIVPVANAQIFNPATLCVAENDGAVEVILQISNVAFDTNSAVNFVGSGMLDAAVSLTTDCALPVKGGAPTISVVLSEGADGSSLDFSVSASGGGIIAGSSDTSGNIPEGACGQGPQVCPVAPTFENDIPVQ